MLPVTCKLRWLFFWIFTAVCALNEAVNSSIWFANVNDATAADDDVPSKITAKIGEDLKIQCKMNYSLTFFAWYFCQSDYTSPTAEWKIVVKVDHSIKNITGNQSKFALDPDGSLILKDIQEKNDHNWCRCFYKERFVGLHHRSTIIVVFQEPVFITSDKEYKVIENMPLVMFSDVVGYPSPWVVWIRNGQVLQNKSNGPNYLLRRHATIEDAGNYTCMAGNFAGVTNFTYQLIIRVDGPPGESTASPQTQSTAERPTAESTATSQAHGESKRPPETQSTGTTRKADQNGICLGDKVAIALGVVMVVIALAVTAVWCVICRRQNQQRERVVRYLVDANDKE